ncbi:MAG: universal stress protein [Cyanobacteria bacterium HKST-UBA02]|nr:universal stress protein [Cyanobacteria bacterium HKST-UBA02]
MKVILAMDHSDCADAALKAVLERQWTAADEITIVTVLDLFEVLPSFSFDREKAFADARSLVEADAEKLRQAFPETLVNTELLEGYPHVKLAELARETGADCVYLGAHGRRAFSQLLLGSVANSMLFHAPCSVNIIKTTDLASGGRYKHVLIAVDDSEHSRASMDQILEMQWPDDVTFHVINVLENPVYLTKQEIEERTARLAEKAEKMLSEYCSSLGKRFGEGRCHFELMHGHPREQILNKARQLPAGLIVLGSHGRDFVETMVLGSVSQAVALQAPCSVAIMRKRSEVSGGSEESSRKTEKALQKSS